MKFVDALKERIPDWAKDVRLNVDGVILRSSLTPADAAGVALAAAFSCGDAVLVAAIRAEGVLPPAEETACLTAASLMAMNNVWYPYVEMADNAELKTQPAQLRMNAYANHGGVTKRQFEMYALAASIVGKCHFCVKSHHDTLRGEGMTALNMRDIGRIASVVAAACKVAAVAGT